MDGRTDGRTDGRVDGLMERQTRPLIEMRSRIKELTTATTFAAILAAFTVVYCTSDENLQPALSF